MTGGRPMGAAVTGQAGFADWTTSTRRIPHRYASDNFANGHPHAERSKRAR
jgi:hypothetical protein